jgi:hypothetical protein
VTLEQQHQTRLAARLALLFAAAALLMVWILPGARQTFDYLSAGTFASAVTITAAFGLFVSGRL